MLIQSGRSTPLSNVSTLSSSTTNVSLDLEEDSPLSQSLASLSVPVLKKTKPTEFPEQPKKSETCGPRLQATNFVKSKRICATE